MIIRQVLPEEWHLLEPIFAAEGGNLPQPTTANVFGAFEGDKLVGFWCFQLAYHAGPLWIAPEHRGTRLWKRLNDSICDWLKDYETKGFYSFSGSPKVDNILTKLGYTNLGYKVFKKEKK